jgi:hypothetical protein
VQHENWASPLIGDVPVSAAVIRASYNDTSDPASTADPIAPPPWPATAGDDEPRTHTVVDGDSLARLAGLYLDDPRRGGEIFEANRGVLSDPELLPIGAELVIPSRASAAAVKHDSSQSYVPQSLAHRLPALVPVRPIPTGSRVAPRAHLGRPMPVE